MKRWSKNNVRGVDVEASPRPEGTYGAVYAKRSVGCEKKVRWTSMKRPNLHMHLQITLRRPAVQCWQRGQQTFVIIEGAQRATPSLSTLIHCHSISSDRQVFASLLHGIARQPARDLIPRPNHQGMTWMYNYTWPGTAASDTP